MGRQAEVIAHLREQAVLAEARSREQRDTVAVLSQQAAELKRQLATGCVPGRAARFSIFDVPVLANFPSQVFVRRVLEGMGGMGGMGSATARVEELAGEVARKDAQLQEALPQPPLPPGET